LRPISVNDLKKMTIVELREMLQMIWDSLQHGLIDKALKKFPKHLKLRVDKLNACSHCIIPTLYWVV